LVSKAPLNSGVDFRAVDKNLRAQGDFFSPVNGVWLTQTAVPADKSRYGSCNVLYDDSQENLTTFIQTSANTGA
jgi:putative endopeptidase